MYTETNLTPDANYLSFSTDHDLDDAVAIYLRKYGTVPQHWSRDANLLRLGPVEGTSSPSKPPIQESLYD